MQQRQDPHNLDPRYAHHAEYPYYPPYWPSAEAYYEHYYGRHSMLPPAPTMTTAPHNVRPLDEGRASEAAQRSSVLRTFDYQTTADGDIVVVQPSFDEGIDRKGGNLPQIKEWEVNAGDVEGMHDGSPDKYSSAHARNLSAHFFDATSLYDPEQGDDAYEERKHRRIFSGDVTNPRVAHRRLDSTGASTAIRRDFGPPPAQHHRVDSAGLEMLSAAADASTDELAAAAGARNSNSPWDRPPPSSDDDRPAKTGSYDQSPYAQQNSMNPPLPVPTGTVSSLAPSQDAYLSSQPVYGGVQYGMPPPGPPLYYGGQPYARTAQGYPIQAARQPTVAQQVYASAQYQDRRAGWDKPVAEHGAQTFVTTIGVGNGNKLMMPTGATRNVGTTMDDMMLGHHRKMSSFTAFNTILGNSLFAPGELDQPSHHRKNSSTVSFLQGLDLDGADDMFLRNLQASNYSVDFGMHPPQQSLSPPPPPRGAASPDSEEEDEDDDDVGSPGGSKLASGGTSKRVRRKCTIEGCGNRVVQGGLCIAHGAKRKTCNHPGCNKNVKKAGLCSTHGPARKRCENEGCNKVAVQGGKCITHGAKKKLCFVSGCTKQAILSGMCKKHHDQNNVKLNSELVCEEIKSAPSGKPGHSRGLSIFQEMSAETVSSLLNDSVGQIEPENRDSRGANFW